MQSKEFFSGTKVYVPQDVEELHIEGVEISHFHQLQSWPAGTLRRGTKSRSLWMRTSFSRVDCGSHL